MSPLRNPTESFSFFILKYVFLLLNTISGTLMRCNINLFSGTSQKDCLIPGEKLGLILGTVKTLASSSVWYVPTLTFKENCNQMRVKRFQISYLICVKCNRPFKFISIFASWHIHVYTQMCIHTDIPKINRWKHIITSMYN